ncbi:MAG: hypothetical protein CBB68_11880 [Rhodospirillaceae bacterium TMED8]|nr:hypothetical protein [Magnetovibrio sp.]OUT49268.1 MAG: hypothetical protein CBB68_11880 [Rhodospirillaceae bacterium TMED8]|tara:strand:+ start:888 stop:1163 length:276 start_codon:yes stop_codon:yes gene_type:complete
MNRIIYDLPNFPKLDYSIEMMRKLLPVLMVFGVFLGSAEKSFALPECTGITENFASIIDSWPDCFVTYTDANRNKYVSGQKDGKQHGQGTI